MSSLVTHILSLYEELVSLSHCLLSSLKEPFSFSRLLSLFLPLSPSLSSFARLLRSVYKGPESLE